jgi:hypothetical protein
VSIRCSTLLTRGAWRCADDDRGVGEQLADAWEADRSKSGACGGSVVALAPIGVVVELEPDVKEM